MYVVFEVLYPEEAKDLAERWAAGRQERLEWLQAQLEIDPVGALMTELWAAVLAWHVGGRGLATASGPCPIWWVDEYDLDDSHVMADALAHPFCDEALRREPDLRLKVLNEPRTWNHRQLVMALGRGNTPPWAVPLACMDALRPDAEDQKATRRPQRSLTSAMSTTPDYLEGELQAMIRAFDPWKQELANKERR